MYKVFKLDPNKERETYQGFDYIILLNSILNINNKEGFEVYQISDRNTAYYGLLNKNDFFDDVSINYDFVGECTSLDAFYEKYYAKEDKLDKLESYLFENIDSLCVFDINNKTLSSVATLSRNGDCIQLNLEQ